MRGLGASSWSYGARVGRASKDKCDQAFIPLHPFLRGVYPLLAINWPKNSKWGRRIIIQRKKIHSIPICCYFSSNKSTCSCYVVPQNNTFSFFLPSGRLHYSEASETLSASRYSQFSSLLLACLENSSESNRAFCLMQINFLIKLCTWI